MKVSRTKNPLEVISSMCFYILYSVEKILIAILQKVYMIIWSVMRYHSMIKRGVAVSKISPSNSWSLFIIFLRSLEKNVQLIAFRVLFNLSRSGCSFRTVDPSGEVSKRLWSSSTFYSWALTLWEIPLKCRLLRLRRGLSNNFSDRINLNWSVPIIWPHF